MVGTGEMMNSTTAANSTLIFGRPEVAHVWRDSRDDAWLELEMELSNWIKNPAELVEPDAQAPSRMLIRAARDMLCRMRQVGDWPAPNVVSPDNSGGIAVEWHFSDGRFRLLSFLPNHNVTISEFRNGQFISRHNLNR
jgi:hypothetical protein